MVLNHVAKDETTEQHNSMLLVNSGLNKQFRAVLKKSATGWPIITLKDHHIYYMSKKRAAEDEADRRPSMLRLRVFLSRYAGLNIHIHLSCHCMWMQNNPPIKGDDVYLKIHAKHLKENIKASVQKWRQEQDAAVANVLGQHKPKAAETPKRKKAAHDTGGKKKGDEKINDESNPTQLMGDKFGVHVWFIKPSLAEHAAMKLKGHDQHGGAGCPFREAQSMLNTDADIMDNIAYGIYFAKLQEKK